MNQCSIGRQNGKRAGALTGACQLEHQVIPADQQVGIAVLGEFQKHLVVRVSAFGQRREGRFSIVSNWEHCQVRAVALQQILSAGGIQSELRVTGNAFQFGQRVLVRQADDLVIANRLRQCSQWRGFEMKQIHHDIGVQHQSGQKFDG